MKFIFTPSLPHAVKHFNAKTYQPSTNNVTGFFSVESKELNNLNSYLIYILLYDVIIFFTIL